MTMPQTTQLTMKCTACGLKYPWSPQNAGKKVKCKCGTIFVAPQTVEGAPPAAASASQPKVQAAVAKMAQPVAKQSPPPTPKLDEDDDAGMYDLAGDMEAPPPLTPVASVVPSTVPTPKTTGAKKGAAARAGMPSFPGRATTPQYDDSEEKKAQIKKLVIVGIGVALLVGIVVLVKSLGLVGGDKTADYANLPGEDGSFMTRKDRDGAYEAKAWMEQNNSRGIIGFEWTRDRTIRKIDEWYAQGAKNVFSFGQSPFTRALAIELPDDPAKRKVIIDYAEQFRVDRFQNTKPPVTDVGQKFVILDFM